MSPLDLLISIHLEETLGDLQDLFLCFLEQPEIALNCSLSGEVIQLSKNWFFFFL